MESLKNLFSGSSLDVQVAHDSSKMRYLEACMDDKDRSEFNYTMRQKLIEVYLYRVVPGSLLAYVATMGVLSMIPTIRRAYGPLGWRFLNRYFKERPLACATSYWVLFCGLGFANIPVIERKCDPTFVEIFNKYRDGYEDWKESFNIPDEEDL